MSFKSSVCLHACAFSTKHKHVPVNEFNVFIHIYMRPFSTCKIKQALFHLHMCVLFLPNVDDLRWLRRGGAPRKRGKDEGEKLPDTRARIQHKHRYYSEITLKLSVTHGRVVESFVYLSSPGPNCLRLQREVQRQRGGKVRKWRKGNGSRLACSLSGWLTVQRLLVQSAAGLWGEEEAGSCDN